MRKITLLLCVCLLFTFGHSQILSEGFETYPPTGWIDVPGAGADSGNLWAQNAINFNSGANSAFYDDFNADNDRWLISPALDLSGTSTPGLTYFDAVGFPSFADTHDVLYSTDYSGSGDPTAATWTLVNGVIGTGVWTENGPYALPVSSTVYIAFHYVGNFAAEWYIDDITVDDVCFADAGGLTADANPVELVGTTTISATPDGNISVPADYEVLYVLTEGAALTIQDTNTTGPSFDVTVAGEYTIHTLVAELSDNTDPNFLDLTGLTTGVEVLDAITNQGVCASLDAAGAPILVSSCLAVAGTLTADANPVPLSGTTTISATANGDIFVPTDYEILYVLTEGAALTIQDTNTTGPSFDVTTLGDYTIHTLVAELSDNTDPNFLDLTGVVTGVDVLNEIANQGVCADLDAAGAPVAVVAPAANDDCANATVVTAPSTTAFDTNIATADGPTDTCGTAPGGPNVWFAYTASGNGDLLVSTCDDADFDTKINVYEGGCGALTCVDGNDDGTGCADFTSELTIAVTSGTTYYVAVSGFDGAQGIGNLTLDFTLSNGQELDNPSAFTYYPNPVENTLTLNAASSNIDNVVMFNMLGQQVMQLQPNALNSELDMSSLQTGTYFVKVTVANETKTIRVVKQ